MAGYSGTPLERKLGVKPEHVVFLDGAPDGFDLDAPTTRRLPRSLDLSLTFHTRRSTLTKRAADSSSSAPARPGMVWVCWPKAAAKVDTDLDGNVVRQIGLDAGFVDVKVCAIDETWSGLKFVRRLADRT